jgi:Na+-driven multidrug efflux pump
MVKVSFPIMVDKATMAFSVIWLMKMMRPLGVKGLAAFGVINDMTRFALIPSLAFAQIITFLVSNDFGASNWMGIRANIKKTVILSLGAVFLILTLLACNATSVIQCFDRSCDFTLMASTLFPLLSILVVFDVLQLVLSGALRGAADVKTVMFVRLAVFLLYFMPVSYALSCVPMDNVLLKFLLIYGSFYGGHALMTIVYIKRLRSEKWQEIRSEGNE